MVIWCWCWLVGLLHDPTSEHLPVPTPLPLVCYFWELVNRLVDARISPAALFRFPLPNNIWEGELRVDVPSDLQVFTSIVFCRVVIVFFAFNNWKEDILVKFLNWILYWPLYIYCRPRLTCRRLVEQEACLQRSRRGD